MQLGVAVPVSGSWATPENCLEVAARAEGLGYRSLWTFQRLLSPVDAAGEEQLAPPYHRVHDPLAVLAYLAGRTRSARLGVAVVNAPFYPPVLLAKTLATIDHLSGGRLDVGLGSGWLPQELETAGVPASNRGTRTEELLRCLDAIWTDDVVDFRGDHYRVPPSRIEPKPLQQPRPPVLLGAKAEPALRRAGRMGDGWISSGLADLSAVDRSIAVVRAAAREAGRDPDGLRIICRAAVKVRDHERGHLVGSIEEIRTDLDRLAAAGVTEAFVDLNFDPLVGSPDADPGRSMEHARRVLEALAPG